MTADDLAGRVDALYRYPVKGLSPEPLDTVTLTAGAGVPLDRALGFLRHETEYDVAAPRPMPKTNFHMLAKDAALARLRTRYDDATDTLTSKLTLPLARRLAASHRSFFFDFFLVQAVRRRTKKNKNTKRWPTATTRHASFECSTRSCSVLRLPCPTTRRVR